MQPAFFNDGQTLSSIHYHIDACFWKGDRLIDGTTFLLPSKVPKVPLEFYIVDLDEVTCVHHVFCRKMSLRTILSMTDPSQSQFASHVAEFSNGHLTAVPRVNISAPVSKQKARMCGKDNAVEPIRHQLVDNLPSLANRPVTESHNNIAIETYSTPVGLANSISRSALVSGQVATSHSATSRSLFRKLSPDLIVAASCAQDDSIVGFGHVVGQRVADDKSSLSNFPKSIIHNLPWNATTSPPTDTEASDATAPVQKRRDIAINKEMSTTATSSRRPSNGGQGDSSPTSTMPTSPSSSTFSTLPYCCTIKALALEESKKHDSSKSNGPDRAVRRRSWDLSYTFRQRKYWDEIQKFSRSPRLDFLPAPKSGLTITEVGQITMVGDISNEGKPSLTLPQIAPRPVEALNFSPRRVMPGGCDHAHTDDPETEVKEQCPNVDWGFRECVELFNATSTKNRIIVDPKYDNHVTKLLGRGTLAQTFMSGRTTGRMETLLGPNAVEMMMDGQGIPRATRGMVTLLGTGNVPQTPYDSQGRGVGVVVPSSDLANDVASGRSTPSCSTESAETLQSPVLSYHTRNTSLETIVEESTDLLDKEEIEGFAKEEETANGAATSVEGSRDTAFSLVLIHVLEQFAEEKLRGAENSIRFPQIAETVLLPDSP